MDHVHQHKFLKSQLFALVALQSVKQSCKLNALASEACDDAILVASSTIDKILADNPSLESSTDNIVKSFEIPNGQS